MSVDIRQPARHYDRIRVQFQALFQQIPIALPSSINIPYTVILQRQCQSPWTQPVHSHLSPAKETVFIYTSCVQPDATVIRVDRYPRSPERMRQPSVSYA